MSSSYIHTRMCMNIGMCLYVSFICSSVFWPWGYFSTVQTFLDGEHIDLLTKETISQLLLGAAERITSRYYELAADVVNVVSWWIHICKFKTPHSFYLSHLGLNFSLKARKTESSLLRLRQGAQRRVGASSDSSDNNISDTDKICMQLFLDIQVCDQLFSHHHHKSHDKLYNMHSVRIYEVVAVIVSNVEVYPHYLWNYSFWPLLIFCRSKSSRCEKWPSSALLICLVYYQVC